MKSTMRQLKFLKNLEIITVCGILATLALYDCRVISCIAAHGCWIFGIIIYRIIYDIAEARITQNNEA